MLPWTFFAFVGAAVAVSTALAIYGPSIPDRALGEGALVLFGMTFVICSALNALIYFGAIKPPPWG